jgi:hypothetical protein
MILTEIKQRFFLDTNPISLQIETLADWDYAVTTIATAWNLTRAEVEQDLLRRARRSQLNRDSYGLYQEHTGKTLAMLLGVQI